jgi:hypothetical protein
MYTIFCDDVRQETTGKLSFVGVYLNTMVVPSFPIQLPKFCLVMTVRTPERQPFKDLVFKVLLDDSVLVELPIPETALQQNIERAQTDDERFLIFTAVTQIAPLQLAASSVIRARAFADSTELKGGALRVEQGPIPMIHAAPAAAKPTVHG